MANNGVNNQKKMNYVLNGCRYITVVLGMILLSAWTVKSASQVNPTKQELQQNLYKEITGIVKTEDGDPIPGATVLKVGTNEATETDVDGRYKFNVKKGNRIQFICRGYKTSIATVRRSNVLNVKMKENDTEMPDVVISFNYHSATGCTIDTVSVKRIEENELSKNHIVDIAFPLIFNIDVTYRNPQIILKEVGDLTRNGNYTYIVDGVRVSEETFRSLNQNDVESVDICKHTDMYNARFGNKENQSRITLEAI